MINTNGVRTTINITEPIYDEELNKTAIPRPFLAYSIAGTAESVI